MSVLNEADLPYLVAGAYALACYTGVSRQTKDFDLFVRGEDVKAMLAALSSGGFETELMSDLWLAKAFDEGEMIDLIFNSGNGLCRVDDFWFARAPRCEVLGMDALICPAEEIIWTKAFIMERGRYDGADIAHLLRAQADELDWERLLYLFGAHWRVLYSHLILFGFIYPDVRHKIPLEILDEMARRLHAEQRSPAQASNLCGGTLLSRWQYLVDIDEWGMHDGRIRPHGHMTSDEADALSYHPEIARNKETPPPRVIQSVSEHAPPGEDEGGEEGPSEDETKKAS